MSKHRSFLKIPLLAVAALVAIISSVQYVQANTVTTLFHDDFSRADSSSLGNNWTENESKSTAAKIGSDRLVLTPTDEAYSPTLTQQFSQQTEGTIELTYDFDWTMTSSENTYGVHVQLGDSSIMSGADSDSGVAVDIKWAGPAYGMTDHEGLGYVDSNANTVQLAQASGPTTVKAIVDLDANTFDLDINPIDGVVEATDIDLVNNVSIDTLRIFTDSVNYRKFSNRAFDNILIQSTNQAPEEPSPTGPIISDVNASDILDTTTSISWQTNKPADGQVSYGLTSCACDHQTDLQTNLATDHLHYLESLQPDTTYYYTVASRDDDGNLATSSVHTFQTTPEPDTTNPVIESIDAVSLTSTSATISVETDEPTSTEISYGTTSCACAFQANPSSINTNHQVALTGLQASTTYHYRVSVKDTSGNSATSSVASFTTPTQTIGSEILNDDFNRPNSSDVGNSWIEQEVKDSHASINNQRLELTAKDDSFSPIVSRYFTRQNSGTLEWTFDTRWELNGSENNYEVVMQLGDSVAMSDPSQNDQAGTAVNLKWASPSFGMNNHEGFGYATQTGTTQLTTLSGSTRVRVEANIDSSTYSIDINPSDGVVEAANIPFSGANGIDTIRFYTNALNGSKVSGRWIDNIVISNLDGDTPGPIDTTPPVISEAELSSVGARTATVAWSTNELTTAQIQYGTSACPCTSSTSLQNIPSNSHNIRLTNLDPETTYYYQIVATDLAGNQTVSQAASFTTDEASNVLTVQNNWVMRDGEPVKLMGVRTASATYDQAQTDHLIDQLDEYKAHGINTVTVFYMGSRDANYDPFEQNGLSINAGHQDRMEQIIQAADARDMMVIVGIFYQAAPNKLPDGPAFFNAVRTVAASLSQYDNIIINIANEQNSAGYARHADKADINDPQTIIDMAAAVHDVDPDRIVGGGGYDVNNNIELGLSSEIDILLFDTGGGNRNSGTLYDNYVAAGVTKPMVNVEMFGGLTSKYDRGVFSSDYKESYTDEVDRAEARAPLGLFFHNGPWMQVKPMRYDLGGYGTAQDPGIRWYFEYVRDNITHP